MAPVPAHGVSPMVRRAIGLSVVIPAYNEQRRPGPTGRLVLDYELLVVGQRKGLRVAEAPDERAHQSGSKISAAAGGLRMTRDLSRIPALALRGIYDRSQSVSGALPTPRPTRCAADV